MGEPGVGKSRLFYEFKLLSQRGCLVLETFSVSHGKAYPYLPLIDLLKNYFQITLQDDERQRREKIGGKVLMLDRNLEDTLPYLFALLSIDEPTSSLQQMDPQIRKRRTFEAIKRLLMRESLNQPLILIFEDLHWLDGETQAFLTLLSESIATAKILLLVNYRPEYHHEWSNKTFFSQLRLDPLGQAEAEEMLATLLEEKGGTQLRPGSSTGHAPLQSLKRFILEKTEGNPFFMEEIIQALREQGVLTGPRRVGTAHLNVGARTGSASRSPDTAAGRELLPTDLHLPLTVQGVLAARIDRLPPEEKALLQTLSVIGKEFLLSLVKQVVDRSEDELHTLLSHLQTAEFIYEQPAFPEVEYTFKHALTQEVAYNSLLLERRKVLHERTAGAIEEFYRQQLEEHYSDLAHHYSRSDNTRKAVEYLGLAGQQAVQRSAYTEAITHLTTALGLLKTLPDTPERTQQELDLQLTLGPALMATKGWAAPEAGEAYTRARELCRQVGETPQLFRALFGLWLFYVVREKLQPLRELGEQLLSLAQSVQDPTRLLAAHVALGYELYLLGEFVPAQEQVEQGIALYDLEQYRALTLFYGGTDPGVYSLSLAAWSLWVLGYPDQALKKSHEALTLGQELAHPFSLAFALCFATELHQLRQESQATQEQAAALITLSTEQGFPFWLARGTIVQGWVLSEQGQGEEGIVQIRQGLDVYRATGAEIWRSYHRALLAEAHGKVGQAEEGLAVVIEALDRAHGNGDRYYEAELYRLKGTLTLQSKTSLGRVSSKSQASQDKSEDTNPQSLTPNPQAEAEAEACFLKAIEIAQWQEARSWELRASVSLARLWQSQGKKDEARQILAEIYGWFTEGFDTADLKEAQELLKTFSE
jgi:predicted ATPase